MTYIVTENCIKCKYMDCVEVCPVDCFYEGENMLVIHPDECIDCGVCEPECPVEAIKPDTEPGLEKFLKLNADFAKVWPNITVKKPRGKRPLETSVKVPVKAAVKQPPPKPAPRHKPDEGSSPVMNNKKATQRHGFKTNEFIVYPSHGVGQIVAIEEQEVAGAKLELFVINFVKDKMTLRVPIAKMASVGMRKLSEDKVVKKALGTLKGKARVKRTMWSRRAQEYEAKINSGDIVAIAEVVRDLYRSDTQPEQSYSERQLYEAALDRLSREISAVQRITETEAIKEIEASLAKGPRRGPKPAEEAADEV